MWWMMGKGKGWVTAEYALLFVVLSDRKHWVWLAVWLGTRAFIVAEVGFWVSGHL